MYQEVFLLAYVYIISCFLCIANFCRIIRKENNYQNNRNTALYERSAMSLYYRRAGKPRPTSIPHRPCRIRYRFAQQMSSEAVRLSAENKHDNFPALPESLPDFIDQKSPFQREQVVGSSQKIPLPCYLATGFLNCLRRIRLMYWKNLFLPSF